MAKQKNRRIEKLKKELKSNKTALFAFIFLSFIILASIFAFLSPYSPNAVNVGKVLEKPNGSHLFGTDELGRDYLTRALYGGRISLTVGLLAMAISTCIGVLVGTVSGYFGGKIDNLLMRIVDIISSIPWMILVTVISIFLTPGLKAIILVIGLFTWMGTARLVRAETLTIKEREYVLYAKASGQSFWKIIFKHIIPGALPTFIVASTVSIANAILMESALSFLGLGVQQPLSSWGSMLQTAQGNLASAPYMAILPGVLIVLTVYSFNKLGDVLRVVVEPKTGK
ncbi:peptide ABC transporter permease [Heyndrickxia shackletonii]|uniref:Peptide ABC transporter permease n=1 Tax=Heyndrickxia shackletonii TaxID=157838 RepID=A0A0Q3WTY4_9BACI|nr:ABC transporter permease [Heyndrickxia shackletonii]KQL52378.1 peptide ABC transporter permease [Heyndrickxia shackletonii]MBB2479153.1 ABC transporter permease [Bacillus sp. APMAM]NEY99063.1 ABC transporter permease [Heyndrickxia shackletonii]RTZ57056.1 ABC transporter permease [Bacillus sp. SAJ1]